MEPVVRRSLAKDPGPAVSNRTRSEDDAHMGAGATSCGQDASNGDRGSQKRGQNGAEVVPIPVLILSLLMGGFA